MNLCACFFFFFPSISLTVSGTILSVDVLVYNSNLSSFTRPAILVYHAREKNIKHGMKKRGQHQVVRKPIISKKPLYQQIFFHHN